MDVLILVLVEHTLGAIINEQPKFFSRLNPCFSGTYSRRAQQQRGGLSFVRVLILVLVEHTLGGLVES